MIQVLTQFRITSKIVKYLGPLLTHETFSMSFCQPRKQFPNVEAYAALDLLHLLLL